MELGISGLDHAYEIGAGGSAVVYRARQTDLDREVAVKVLSVTDESFVRRFKREAKTLGKLGQGGSIVTVYDTGITDGGHPYLILELCTTSVLEQLNTTGRFEPYAACAAAAQVADALTDAHSHGVVHRDIKPGNILLGQTGRYMVTDFGISTVTGSTFGETNSVGFTAGYVAPETLTESYAGAPADVYALGATLFHMVAGHAPFIDEGQQTNLVALADRVSNEPVPDLRPQGVPEEICRIIESAMAKDPIERPTAGALRDRLLALDADTVGANLGAGLLKSSTIRATASPSAPVRPGSPPVPETPLFGKTVPGRASARPKSPTTMAAAPPAPKARDTVAATAVAPVVSAPARPPSGNGQRGELPPAPPQNRGPSGGDAGNDQQRGVLGDLSLSKALPGPQPASGGILPGLIGELPRKVPVLLISLLGLVGLLAIAAAVILQTFGDSTEDGTGVQAINAPTTSADVADSSDSSAPDGGISTLDVPLAEEEETDPTTTSSTAPPVTAAPAVKVEVPSVVGSTAVAAEATLTDLDFIVKQVAEESDTVDDGDVIRQTPAAGAVADQKSAVTIYVSTPAAAETVTLPALDGKSEADATAALTALGLTNLVETTSEVSDTVATGLVIKTVPAAASEVALDAPVGLVVSSGPAVPACSSVIGATLADATATFETVGLTVTSTEANNPTIADGNVISCTATATVAELVISKGPLANPCGRAEGSQLADAKALLIGAGFTVTETTVEDDTVPEGQVTGCTIIGATAALISAVGTVAVDCPDVTGQTEAVAIAALAAAELTDVNVVRTPNETVDSGLVISCSVAGSTATLRVSTGPAEAEVTVPDVSNEATVDAAIAKLRDAGLAVDEATEANAAAAGTILGTNPAAGATVAEDSTVTLLISSGPVVPDIEGLRRGQALQALQLWGLEADFQTVSVTDPDEIGLVQSTNPAAGTSVAPQTEVTVTIGAR